MEGNRANPTPLALFGLGLILVLTGAYEAPFWYPPDSMYGSRTLVVIAVLLGATLLFIGGLLHFRRMDTVGLVAFTGFGLFWPLLLVVEARLDLGMLGYGVSLETAPEHLGWYLFLWGVLAAVALLASGQRGIGVRAVFATFLVYLWLLAAYCWIVGYWPGQTALDAGDWLRSIARWEGVLCGVLALYVAAAMVVNEAEGRTVLPIEPKEKLPPPPPIHEEL
jgi:succinate-acetate transporter protein